MRVREKNKDPVRGLEPIVHIEHPTALAVDAQNAVGQHERGQIARVRRAPLLGFVHDNRDLCARFDWLYVRAKAKRCVHAATDAVCFFNRSVALMGAHILSVRPNRLP